MLIYNKSNYRTIIGEMIFKNATAVYKAVGLFENVAMQTKEMLNEMDSNKGKCKFSKC